MLYSKIIHFEAAVLEWTRPRLHGKILLRKLMVDKRHLDLTLTAVIVQYIQNE